jgi:hypothetical protein
MMISLLLSRLSLIVMSVHRHCAWLKPETAAKIEQLANASGQSDTKRRRICDYPKLEHALFLWYRGHETRGAAVTGDADSEGQGACVDP